MGQYKAISVSETFKVCALLIAAASAFGCSTAAQKNDAYRINVPPARQQTARGPSDSSPQPVAATQATVPAEAGLAPQAARLREDAPLHYVVKKGDTLWGIANHFLLDAWQWPEIWYVNDKIKNPHLIYPGDVLTLIYVDGKPHLVTGETGTDVSAYGNVVRLSPGVRPEGLEAAIPAIPMDAIRDFLSSTRIVTPQQMEAAPYVVAFVDPQLTAGAGSVAYVKNAKDDGDFSYSIARMGQPFRDPDAGEILGYEALPVGNAEITDYGKKFATANLVRTVREVRPGDRLLPLEEESYDAYFYPKAPRKQISGRIIGALDGVSQITQFQVVTLNRGSSAGIERGDVLTIMQTGRTARDPESAFADTQVQLPDVPAGTLMVFKVTPRLSFALVVTATRAIHILDKVENPKSLH